MDSPVLAAYHTTIQHMTPGEALPLALERASQHLRHCRIWPPENDVERWYRVPESIGNQNP